MVLPHSNPSAKRYLYLLAMQNKIRLTKTETVGKGCWQNEHGQEACKTAIHRHLGLNW